MPYSLAIAFQESRNVEINENRYLNGEAQHGLLVATSRKRFVMTKRLTAAQLADLRTFFMDRRGEVEEFWFYNVWETSPQFFYDPTGAAVDGRYAVRFDGNFQQSLQLGRNQAQIALIEVS